MKKLIISCVVLLLIIVLIGLIPLLIWQPIDSSKKCSTGEFIYYLSSVILMFATLAAVIVALFKEVISKLIWRPRVAVSFTDPNGFSENVNSSQKTPSASSYLCYVTFENIGNSEAAQCQLLISRVQYRKKSTSSWKELRCGRSVNVVKWGRDRVDNIDIPVSISNTLELFKINLSDNQTLTSNTDIPEKPVIILHGFDQKKEFGSSGEWKIDYFLKYRIGNSIAFTIIIIWDGSWRTRKEEMKDCLNIKLIKK